MVLGFAGFCVGRIRGGKERTISAPGRPTRRLPKPASWPGEAKQVTQHLHDHPQPFQTAPLCISSTEFPESSAGPRLCAGFGLRLGLKAPGEPQLPGTCPPGLTPSLLKEPRVSSGWIEAKNFCQQTLHVMSMYVCDMLSGYLFWGCFRQKLKGNQGPCVVSACSSANHSARQTEGPPKRRRL